MPRWPWTRGVAAEAQAAAAGCPPRSAAVLLADSEVRALIELESEDVFRLTVIALLDRLQED
jgi:hypothetical protein